MVLRDEEVANPLRGRPTVTRGEFHQNRNAIHRGEELGLLSGRR